MATQSMDTCVEAGVIVDTAALQEQVQHLIAQVAASEKTHHEQIEAMRQQIRTNPVVTPSGQDTLPAEENAPHMCPLEKTTGIALRVAAVDETTSTPLPAHKALIGTTALTKGKGKGKPDAGVEY